MRCLLVTLFFLTACTSTPVAPPVPPLAFGDFIDEVLTPLSAQKADEVLTQVKAKLEVRYREGANTSELWKIVGNVASAVGYPLASVGINTLSALAGDRQREHEVALARLEAERIPLQKKLLQLYTSRTSQQEGRYRFCADGKLRQYEIRGLRFARLEDDPAAACPLQRLVLGE